VSDNNENPCPTCKGNCCLNCYSDSDERVPHVEYAEDDSYHDRGYAHACPDCDEGKAPPPFKWTDVDEEYRMAPGYAKTQRAPVPGGYLYRIVHYTDSGEVSSFGGLAFVPARWHL